MSLGSNGHLRVAVERMRAAARSSLGGRPARPQRQPEHPSRAASPGPFDTPRRDSCWGHVDVRACAATPCTPVALLPARVTLPTRHFRTGHAPDAHGPWHIRPGTQSRRSATGWDPGSASSDTMGPGERIERQDGTHRRIECQVGTRIRPILRTSLSLNTAGGPSLSLNTADGPSLTLSATSGPNLTSGAWTRCGPKNGHAATRRGLTHGLTRGVHSGDAEQQAPENRPRALTVTRVHAAPHHSREFAAHRSGRRPLHVHMQQASAAWMSSGRKTRQPSSGNQIGISRAADSSESEPCTRF